MRLILINYFLSRLMQNINNKLYRIQEEKNKIVTFDFSPAVCSLLIQWSRDIINLLPLKDKFVIENNFSKRNCLFGYGFRTIS